GRHHVGPVSDAPVLELLRVSICDGHFGRARAGPPGAGRRTRRGRGVPRVLEGRRLRLSAGNSEAGRRGPGLAAARGGNLRRAGGLRGAPGAVGRGRVGDGPSWRWTE